MRVPEIRYPLAWLAAMVLLALGWRVTWPWSEPVRHALHQRWRRVVAGPPVPHSGTPQAIAGPMVRRVLLLRDDVPAAERPGGRAVETIGRRIFADVYDRWPLTGEPTHYRIGTRGPLGWVAADAVLPWNTRLVVLANPAATGPDTESEPAAPVLGQGAAGLEVVRWAEGAAWRRPAGRAVVPADASTRLGVLISRDELALMLRRLIAGENADELRYRAILGRLADRTPWTPDDLEAVRGALPAAVATRAPAGREQALQALARINRDGPAAASWSGVEFRVVPLEDLP